MLPFDPDIFNAEVKAQLQQIQDRAENLKEQTFVGECADGGIRVTVDISGTVQDISIHVLTKRRNDNLTLSDLLLDAIRNARQEAATARTSITHGLKVFDIPIEPMPSDVKGLSKYMQNFMTRGF